MLRIPLLFRIQTSDSSSGQAMNSLFVYAPKKGSDDAEIGPDHTVPAMRRIRTCWESVKNRVIKRNIQRNQKGEGSSYMETEMTRIVGIIVSTPGFKRIDVKNNAFLGRKIALKGPCLFMTTMLLLFTMLFCGTAWSEISGSGAAAAGARGYDAPYMWYQYVINCDIVNDITDYSTSAFNWLYMDLEKNATSADVGDKTTGTVTIKGASFHWRSDVNAYSGDVYSADVSFGLTYESESSNPVVFSPSSNDDLVSFYGSAETGLPGHQIDWTQNSLVSGNDTVPAFLSVQQQKNRFVPHVQLVTDASGDVTGVNCRFVSPDVPGTAVQVPVGGKWRIDVQKAGGRHFRSTYTDFAADTTPGGTVAIPAIAKANVTQVRFRWFENGFGDGQACYEWRFVFKTLASSGAFSSFANCDMVNDVIDYGTAAFGHIFMDVEANRAEKDADKIAKGTVIIRGASFDWWSEGGSGTVDGVDASFDLTYDRGGDDLVAFVPSSSDKFILFGKTAETGLPGRHIEWNGVTIPDGTDTVPAFLTVQRQLDRFVPHVRLVTNASGFVTGVEWKFVSPDVPGAAVSVPVTGNVSVHLFNDAGQPIFDGGNVHFEAGDTPSGTEVVPAGTVAKAGVGDIRCWWNEDGLGDGNDSYTWIFKLVTRSVVSGDIVSSCDLCRKQIPVEILAHDTSALLFTIPTDLNGVFTTSLDAGDYYIRPSTISGCVFVPVSRSITVSDSPVRAPSFVVVSGCPVSTPTPTPTVSPTTVPGPGPTVAPTTAPTPTKSPTATPKPSVSPTNAPSGTPTPLPEPSVTPMPTITPAPEISPRPTETPLPTEAPRPSPTGAPQPTPTPTEAGITGQNISGGNSQVNSISDDLLGNQRAEYMQGSIMNGGGGGDALSGRESSFGETARQTMAHFMGVSDLSEANSNILVDPAMLIHADGLSRDGTIVISVDIQRTPSDN